MCLFVDGRVANTNGVKDFSVIWLCHRCKQRLCVGVCVRSHHFMWFITTFEALYTATYLVKSFREFKRKYQQNLSNTDWGVWKRDRERERKFQSKYMRVTWNEFNNIMLGFVNKRIANNFLHLKKIVFGIQSKQTLLLLLFFRIEKQQQYWIEGRKIHQMLLSMKFERRTGNNKTS